MTTETTEPVADTTETPQTEKPEAGPAATGAVAVPAVPWESLNVRLLELEQQQPGRRIVRVFAPCDEVPEMFIGAFGCAPVEFAESVKPPAVQWHDGEIVTL